MRWDWQCMVAWDGLGLLGGGGVGFDSVGPSGARVVGFGLGEVMLVGQKGVSGCREGRSTLQLQHSECDGLWNERSSNQAGRGCVRRDHLQCGLTVSKYDTARTDLNCRTREEGKHKQYCQIINQQGNTRPTWLGRSSSQRHPFAPISSLAGSLERVCNKGRFDSDLKGIGGEVEGGGVCC
jgi:hypothetical protein